MCPRPGPARTGRRRTCRCRAPRSTRRRRTASAGPQARGLDVDHSRREGQGLDVGDGRGSAASQVMRHRDVRRRPVRARPGRGHIQYLASVFHPDTPNDVGRGAPTPPMSRRAPGQPAGAPGARHGLPLGVGPAYTYVGWRPVDGRPIVAPWNSACRATSPWRRSSTARSTATPSSDAPPSSPTARSACRRARLRAAGTRDRRGAGRRPASPTSRAGASVATTPSPRSVAPTPGRGRAACARRRTVTRRLRVTATAVTR